jgi:putative membrane protein
MSMLVGLLLMAVFVIAERLGRFIEEPMSNRVFDIPMYRICTVITGNLLGRGHPLAQPRENDKAIVWM